ncbi:hypothetical protein NEF87_000579 [Candidatus Lokiarchaeum ossiferum]|uniref:Acid-resistance membrane protein n=1 Tax=Candidatus Lokiarchaeum ossiferum TaxID=2951803 RepID=A0ABY6HPA1_9ARCH|nr:hypothetical protein NEF87_000579 [Candidatus Lokiarchaeum sp. B-35]
MVKIGVKMPPWLRVFNIIIGMLYILISGALFYNLQLETLTLVYFLAANLFLMGFAKIMNGINYKLVSKGWMLFNFFLGLIFIAASILTIIYPDWGTIGVLVLVGASLLLQGLYRILFAIFNKKIKFWATLMNLIVGLLAVGICIFVFFYQDLALLSLIVILTIIFLLNGVVRILSGVQGYVKLDQEQK